MITALLASGLMAPGALFETPFPLRFDDNTPINAANPVAITFEDYDGDKIKDLIISYRYLGIFCLPNKKANGFESNLEAMKVVRGEEISPIISGGSAQMVDFDGDGIPDIVSGSVTDMLPLSDDGLLWDYLGELQFLKGKGDGKYETARALLDSSREPLKIDAFATVTPVDWNNDGIWDLLVSTRENGDPLRVYLGKGNLQFETPQPVQTAGIPFTRGLGSPTKLQWASIQVVDWNADGTPDLLVGNADGSVYFYPGTRDAQGVLNLGAGQTLVEPLAPETDLKLTGTPYAMPETPRSGFQAAVYATDWNGDGKLDLIVGDVLPLSPKANSLKIEDEAESWSERLVNLVDSCMPADYFLKKYKHLEGQYADNAVLREMGVTNMLLIDWIANWEDKEMQAMNRYIVMLQRNALKPMFVEHPLKLTQDVPRIGRVWVYLRK